MKMAFTDAGVRELQTKAEKAFALGRSDRKERRFFEKQSPGRGGVSLMLNVSYTGTCGWHVLYYRAGKPSTKKLGTFPDMSVKAARLAARSKDIKKLAASKDAGTFKAVAELWLEREVRGKRRSAVEIERQLQTYVYPRWENTNLLEIRRSHVADLLDDIADRKIKKGRKLLGGAVQSDRILATLSRLFNWYTKRSDDFIVPIARGSQRTKSKERQRVLTDDEIRTIWSACDQADRFGAAVRLLLLTGQRLSKIKTMKRRDIDQGIWTIATEDGEKGNAVAIRLPRQALDVIEAIPRVVDCPYVLPGRDKSHYASFSLGKRSFDKLLPKDFAHWTLHDLRRTARTLMQRINVSDDVAERVLGHRRPKIERTYATDPFFDEKSEALQRLADHIALILNPPDTSNVVQMKNTNAPG